MKSEKYVELSKEVKPLFKYIGGKTWLKERLRQEFINVLDKKVIDTYVEPFAGALGSFLGIYDILLQYGIKNVVLSDINPVLIHTYCLIKDNPEILIDNFIRFENHFVASCLVKNNKKLSKEEIKLSLVEANHYFNDVKKQFNENKGIESGEQCARLIFLQKHSFNGIYRENLKGQYNTPFNWSAAHMLDEIYPKVMALHTVLNQFNLSFLAKSFIDINYDENNLYYLDPPYLNIDTGENKYNKESFSLSEQLMLVDKIKDTSFIYSNHAHGPLIERFEKLENISIQYIDRKNTISASTESRKKDKKEILITRIRG